MDRDHLRRITMFVIGLFVMTFGIALSTKADIGTTPISSIPFVVCLSTGVDMYITTFVYNVILVLLQVVVLRKDFKMTNWIQLLVTILFTFFTGITIDLVSEWVPGSYLECWLYVVLSVIIVGTGVALVVNSRTTMVPGEGAVLALSIKTKIPFSRMKVIFDVSNITLAALISLVAFGGLEGVREGTVFAAVTIGFVVGFVTKIIKRIFPDPDNNIS